MYADAQSLILVLTQVGIFYATDITHCYTLECNYNTGVRVNSLVSVMQTSIYIAI